MKEHCQMLFLPKSFTMVASDCRGTSLVFRGVFVALGSRIIPEKTVVSNQILLQCGIDVYGLFFNRALKAVIKEHAIPTEVPKFLSSLYKLYINFEKRIKKYYLHNK